MKADFLCGWLVSVCCRTELCVRQGSNLGIN